MAQLNFNARTVAPDAGFEVIPAGWYIAQIENTEIKPTSDGQGAYLQLDYRILDGKHVNRKTSLRLNIRNNNEQTVRIAYGQLSAICHVTGILDCVDSDLLRGIPHKIKLIVREPRTDKDTGKHYEASNEIKGWKHVNEPTDEPVAPAAGGFGAPAGGAPAGFGAPAGGWAPAPAAAPAAAPAGWGAAPAAAPAQAPAPAAPAAAQPWGQPGQQPPAGFGPAPAAAPAAAPWGAAPAAAPAAPAGGAAPWGGAPAGAAAPAQPAAGGAAPPWQR